jgi:hypothetical protein
MLHVKPGHVTLFLAASVIFFGTASILNPLLSTAAPPTATVALVTPSEHFRPRVPLLVVHPPRRHLTVQPGQTLESIAAARYGSARFWPSLWWVNRSRVKDPDALNAGTILVLSWWHPDRRWLDRAAAAAVPAPPARAASTGPSSIPGGISAFESCVISREDPDHNPAALSTSGSTAGGWFGIENPMWLDAAVPGLLAVTSAYPGGAYTAPTSVQFRAFDLIYAAKGVTPWRPYDGC